MTHGLVDQARHAGTPSTCATPLCKHCRARCTYALPTHMHGPTAWVVCYPTLVCCFVSRHRTAIALIPKKKDMGASPGPAQAPPGRWVLHMLQWTPAPRRGVCWSRAQTHGCPIACTLYCTVQRCAICLTCPERCWGPRVRLDQKPDTSIASMVRAPERHRRPLRPWSMPF